MNTLNIKNLTPEQIKDLRDQLNNYDKNEMKSSYEEMIEELRKEFNIKD